MKIYDNNSVFEVGKPVITIGVFDGVHKGHVEIIKRLNEIANKISGESVVITFWPHPRLVLHKDEEIQLINSLDEKQKLLEQNNIKHLVILPFTKEFSNIRSDEFITNILVKKYHVNHLIVGFNHHFGHAREGNYESICKLATDNSFTVEKLDAKIIENEKVSSTLIRKALSTGDVVTANNYLGYPYMISGKVMEGNKIGRNIGFPTANIKAHHDFKIIPMPGVYAIEASVYDKKYPAMLNIGYRPTIQANPTGLTIEAHLLGFSGDLYEKDMTIFFHQRIRDEMKFSSIDQLKKQLELDKQITNQILQHLNPNKT